MIEVPAIVAYLAGAAGLAGGRWIDRNFDRALEALTDAVIRKIGGQPVSQLRDNPDSVRARNQVADAITREAATDEKFAQELAEIQRKLDNLDGRAWIARFDNSTHIVTQSVGTGLAVGNDYTHNVNTTVDVPGSDDLSRAPAWTRTLLWIGYAIAFFGFFVMIAAMNHGPSDTSAQTGFAIFATGGVLIAFAQLGAQTSKPRRRDRI
ncbi:MRP8 family protein [Nocardia yamanashiensis]|uniref:MRP8 family protein n=1 Tax=Nocardia yamanashiensis TaxID=209247 RepID=UPI001E49612A|nr:MRP8 family protein [Nocardia yamanashiensis]UGT44357.1 MRP8 family protein [Nocardia yamanashiensis]